MRLARKLGDVAGLRSVLEVLAIGNQIKNAYPRDVEFGLLSVAENYRSTVADNAPGFLHFVEHLEPQPLDFLDRGELRCRSHFGRKIGQKLHPVGIISIADRWLCAGDRVFELSPCIAGHLLQHTEKLLQRT